MSTEKTEIETFFGRCRCCLSYGYLKNMWTEHEFEGDTEIYGEMLVQCFALSFHHSEDAMEQDQICEQCVSRLRDANDFKKVVLDSQEELMQQVDAENQATIKEEIEDDKFLMVYEGPESEGDTADTTYADTEYTAGTGDTSESVKDEMEYEEIEYLEEDDAGETKEVVDTDSSLPTENRSRTVKRRKQAQPDSDEGPIKRKWPKRLPKSERLKTYKQYSEEDLRQCLEAVRNNELTPNEASLKYNIPKKTVCAKMKLDPKDVQIDNTMKSTNKHESELYRNKLRHRHTMSSSETPTAAVTKRQSKSVEEEPPVNVDLTKFKAEPEKSEFNDMYKHKDNIKAILDNSNATIIKSYGRHGYSCNFCEEQTENPSALKQHSLKAHTKVGGEAIKTKYVSDLAIKLDITDLKCKLCKVYIDTLEEFLKHLSNTHSKFIHTDIKNYIVPFKFNTDAFRCVICNKSFKYFKLLSEHMTEHYRNFECSICNRGFINKQSMQTHSYRHQRGIFKCFHCPKVFDTRPKRRDHEKTVHIMSGKYRKCAYCDARFSTWDFVVAHELDAHGVKPPENSCEECDKSYSSQSALIMHKNRCHLKLRPYKCTSCDRTFHTKMELHSHIVTHTKTRHFKCEICKKTFGTQSSLNQHMRTHLDDKRYFCDYCNRGFLHKFIFRNHMIRKHGEIV